MSAAAAITAAVQAVTKDWAKQRKAEERDRNAALRRYERLIPSDRVTLRDAPLEDDPHVFVRLRKLLKVADRNYGLRCVQLAGPGGKPIDLTAPPPMPQPAGDPSGWQPGTPRALQAFLGHREPSL